MGLLTQIQKAEQRALRVVHRVLGFKVVYTHVTDLTVDPFPTTDLTIFLAPTPRVKKREKVGGSWEESLDVGGTLSAEALPVYVLSRQDLKVAGTFREPTTMDSFVEFGTTSPIFYVDRTTEIGQRPAGWFLTVTTKFRASGAG